MGSDETAQIPSPCVRICCLDDNDICLGCYRSMAEILRWGEAENNEKRQILTNARSRRSQMLPWLK